MKLRDRVAIVTGAAKGMGGAICASLAREGAHVVAAAREAGALEALVEELRSREGHGRHLAVPTDVTAEEQVAALAHRTQSEFGRVDVLVNAAGVTGPIETPLHKIDPDAWDHVLAVNLKGVFLCCRAVVPMMIEQRYGKIINIAGTSGLRGYRYRAAYSSSKWAVRGLTRTLALEVGPFNVNVNAICPGVVEGGRMTGIIAEKARVRGTTTEDVFGEYVHETALRRFSADDDVAHAVVFLASDDSRQITGHDLVVDGGWDV
ncbi:MAG TPA: SDR family NAD(P)-dependent oxidoreductase [bacterium]|nr:SDR family NAD(P)-dependent oxidoreductase [bacterium]